jgi:hypothetical protein
MEIQKQFYATDISSLTGWKYKNNSTLPTFHPWRDVIQKQFYPTDISSLAGDVMIPATSSNLIKKNILPQMTANSGKTKAADSE